MSKFVQAHIRWKDDGSEGDVLIKLSLDSAEGSREDDAVFFYCNSVADVERLKALDNGEDFVVTEYRPVEVDFNS